MVAVYVADALTHKKAGVNHHLYYRRAQFNSRILTENRILILTVVLVIAIAALCYLLWKKRSSGILLIVSCALGVLWMAVTVAAFYMDFFRSSYAYPYMMAAFALCILLAGVQILLAGKK